MKDKFYILSTLFTLLGLFQCLEGRVAYGYQQDDPRNWQFRAPMPNARTGSAAAVSGDVVYVMGGKDAAGNTLNVVERYNSKTNSWQSAPPLIQARFNATAVSTNGFIYVFGGRDENDSVLAHAERFDPSTQTWVRINNLGEPREGLAGVALSGTVYALGGSDTGEQILNTVEYYDEPANTWRAFPTWDMQVARASFAVVSVSDSAYTFGGFSQFGPLSLVQRFNPLNGVSEKAGLEPARGSLSAAVFDGAIYVIGGRMGNNEVVGTVNRFFPEENVWDLVQPLNEPRENAPAVAIGDQLLVFGGSNSQGNVLNSVEAFERVVTPLALNDAVNTPEDTLVEVNVLANDEDPAGGNLTITGFTQPANGVVSQSGAGLLSYQPAKNFAGVDMFSYTVMNDLGGVALATVTLTVEPVNDAPEFLSEPVTGALINNLYEYAIEAGDVEDDPIQITSDTLPNWLQLQDMGDGTALLSGTPAPADPSPVSVTLFAFDGTETTSQSFELEIVSSFPADPILLSPANQAEIDETTVTFSWLGTAGSTYRFQLATDENFEQVVVDSSLTQTSIELMNLFAEAYFWRVQASNAAGTSNWSVVFSFGRIVHVSTEEDIPTLRFALDPPYPNPFNESASIPFVVHQPAQQLELNVYDLSGRKIRMLLSRSLPPGEYLVHWDGGDAEGRPVASGVYIVRLVAGSEQKTRRLMLVR